MSNLWTDLMKLRLLIERYGTSRLGPLGSANPASPASGRSLPSRGLAELAGLAAAPVPERWPAILRSVSVEGVDLRPAADALERLVKAGLVAEALGLGWDARDLVGLWRFPPHTLPSRAGLVFSLCPGDTVQSIRPTRCVIAVGGGNLRHIWLRASIRDLVLPWPTSAGSTAGPELGPPDGIRLVAGPSRPSGAKSSRAGHCGLPDSKGAHDD